MRHNLMLNAATPLSSTKRKLRTSSTTTTTATECVTTTSGRCLIMSDEAVSGRARKRQEVVLVSRQTATTVRATKRAVENQDWQQQSLTFIADLAQTSTPTRHNKSPITSTPKILSHDPLKYHPTQTIRNKNKKSTQNKQPITVIGSKKRADVTPTRPTKKQRRTISCSVRKCCRVKFQTDNCACCRRGLTTARQRLLSESLTSNRSSLNSDNCNLCNLSDVVSTIIESSRHRRNVRMATTTPRLMSTNQQEQHLIAPTVGKKSTRIKFKTSNIEISLRDFLYTPSKATVTVPAKQQLDLVSIKPAKIKTMPSKVYYL
jgi:hypothetical protein